MCKDRIYAVLDWIRKMVFCRWDWRLMFQSFERIASYIVNKFDHFLMGIIQSPN